MRETLQWGVVGTGGIATDFTNALQKSKRCRVANVTGLTPELSQAFADTWGIPATAASLDDLLADKNVEAVYIGTPHPFHEKMALAAIAAGKPVLCEKPLALDAAATAKVIDAARKKSVFLMEGYMYRGHPLMRELIQRLQDGVIGPIRHVRADFAFRVPRDPEGRLFAKSLGGGGILDVGGYVVSFSRLIAGLIEGAPFAEPVRVQASGVIGPTGADEIATALLTFKSGFTSVVTSAVFHDAGTVTTVFGEKGKIVLPDPWIPSSQRQSLETEYTIFLDGKVPETVKITTDKATYALEAELVADTLPGTEPPWPAMTWADTLANMKVLDTWQAALKAG
jgi:predicted dehydrogenase